MILLARTRAPLLSVPLPSRRSAPVTRGFAIACAAMAVGCTSGAARPQAVGTAIDTAALLHRLEVLAADSMEGRETGTRGAARARRYLLSELERIGVEPVGGSYEHPFDYPGRGGRPAERGVNLLGSIPGTRYPDRHLVVTAHYDHVGIGPPLQGDSIYNGADDNASGVAALLTIAERFRREPPEHTLLFALFDAEEVGLAGAAAFVARPPVPLAAIVATVNLDMVGHSPLGELYAAGTSRYPFLRPLLEPVAARAPVRLLFGHDQPGAGADDWTMQSDQGAFHRAGIPFVFFSVENHEHYHRPSDEPGAITRAFFVGATRTIIDAVRTLDRKAEALMEPTR